ncbi:hypothetical protein [Cohnella sp. GCM10027633]|uniref:hypothetical protein n=1 Tax=unclassified Cohnella TaxID=2636738 RepID=UPI003635288D
MDDIQQTINKIKKNEISKKELIECLDDSNILIIANAIFQVVKLKIHDEITLDKLVHLAKGIEDKPKVLGQYNNAHFALAALFWLDTEKSVKKFDEIAGHIATEKCIILTKLIEERPYLYL